MNEYKIELKAVGEGFARMIKVEADHYEIADGFVRLYRDHSDGYPVEHSAYNKDSVVGIRPVEE